ncbi:vezatin [Aplysia californica]|uniref:Vezatin n=1 Tax=Aplysia californica TaxID=6500 RepID=A0ABM0JKN0_APLCA|nr:vezatin [Aplysia californica]
MESEDEDVVFENSALHQALKECGGPEIETEPRFKASLGAQLEDSQVNDINTTLKSPLSARKYLFGDDKRHSFHLPQWAVLLLVSSATVENLYQTQVQHTLKRVLSSKLLSEDDRAFLSNFIEGEAKTEQSSHWKWSSDLLRIMPFVLIVANVAVMSSVYLPWGLVLLTACLDVPLVGGSVTGVLVMWAVVLAVVLAVSLMVVHAWMIRKICGEFSTREGHLVEFESSALELVHVEKKCLRIIQESEMVARGFTIASQRHLMARFERSDKCVVDQLCPELRDLIVVGNQGLSAGVGDVVRRMTRDVSGTSAVSKFNPLGGLMDLYHTEVGSQTATAAEDLTPGAIKASVDLLGMFLSGLMCRVALCYHQDSLEEDSFNPFAVTVEPVKSLLPVVDSLKSSLASCYSLLRAVHNPGPGVQLSDDGQLKEEEEEDRRSEKKKKKQPASQVESLYTCVHSLDLHLQSVLQITRELTVALEGKLESQVSSTGTSDGQRKMDVNVGVPPPVIGREEAESWEDVLRQVKVGLDSCLECHQESVRRLQQKEDKAATTPGVVTVKAVSPATAQQPAVPPVHIPSEDPVIEDEVFEGVTDCGEESRDSGPARYTDEDRAKLKMFREMAKSLRKELETVVGEKAKEQQLREERALARFRGREKAHAQGHDAPGIEGQRSSDLQNVVCNNEKTGDFYMSSSAYGSRFKESGAAGGLGVSGGSDDDSVDNSIDDSDCVVGDGDCADAEHGEMMRAEVVDRVSQGAERCDGESGTRPSLNPHCSAESGQIVTEKVCNGEKILGESADSRGEISENNVCRSSDGESSTGVQSSKSGHDNTDSSLVFLSAVDENEEGDLLTDLTRVREFVQPTQKRPIPRKRKSKNVVAEGSEEEVKEVVGQLEAVTAVSANECGSGSFSRSVTGDKITDSHPSILDRLCSDGDDAKSPSYRDETSGPDETSVGDNVVQRTGGGGGDAERPTFFPSSSLSFTSSLAAMAASRARLLQNTSNEETFGDSSSEEDLS